MGKIAQGILGGLSGKVGNIIGGSWKGIDYIRIKPSSVANPRTVGQVNQRNKFTVTLEFIQAVKPFIQKGYKFLAVKKTAFNAAMSYVLNNAIGGVEPNFNVDYANALVSRGGLSTALNPTTDLTTAGEVTFNWESISLTDGADRTVGSQIVDIPTACAGNTVELFMAFITADGSQVSNSTYLGSGTAN